MKYIATGEFNKYGMADVILALEHKEPLHFFLYPEVMFDEGICAEQPEHKEFIENIAIPRLSELGVMVIRSRCKKTYKDIFNRIVSDSPVEERNGLFRGFPKNLQCYIKTEIKRQKIDQFIRAQQEPVTEYVGKPVKDRPEKNRISLVKKYGLTSDDCTDLCKKYGLYSPAYRFAEDMGCWFCSNSSCEELRHLRKYHPELWEELIRLGRTPAKLATPFFSGDTLITDLEEQFYWDEQQMSLWDWFPEGEEQVRPEM